LLTEPIALFACSDICVVRRTV